MHRKYAEIRLEILEIEKNNGYNIYFPVDDEVDNIDLDDFTDRSNPNQTFLQFLQF